MDASSELSDLEETQATQILADLLVPGSSPIKSPDAGGRPSRTGFHADVSESFQSSRNSNSLPAYNLHGLAATQTQTPTDEVEDDEDEGLDGSQKENIQGAGPAKEGRVTPGPFRQGQSREPPLRTNVKTQEGSSLAHSKTRTPNAKPLPIASLQIPMDRSQVRASGSSPSKVDASNAPGRTTRSSKAASARPVPVEDSFAAFDPDFDTEDRPVAQNRHFDVPLSELAGSPEIPGLTSYTRQYRRADPSAKAGEFMPPPPTGRVLVESTPTNSVSSQADSLTENSRYEDGRELIETQIIGHTRTISQESDDYGKSLLRPQYRSSPEPTQLYEATQPATQPSTQPATQVATQLEETQLVDTTTSSGPSAPSLPQTGTNVGQSIPQSHQTTNSLLRGMPPEKQHRYAKYLNTPLPTLPLPIAQPTPQLQQPRSVPAPVQDIVPSTYPQVSPLTNSSPSKVVVSTHAYGQSPDAMEVIPDSEALHSSPIRPTNQNVTKTFIKEREKQVKPSPVTTKKVEVGDEEEEEEEYEAPKEKGKKSKTRAHRRKMVTPPSSSSGSDFEVPPAKRRAVALQDDSSEVEVPLLAKMRASKVRPEASGKSKGKGKVPKANPKAIAVKQASTARTKASGSRGSATSRSWEDSIVPSSMPEQDFPQSKSRVPQKQTKKQPVASTSSKRLTPDEDSDGAGEDYDEEAGDSLDDDMDVIGDEPSGHRKRKRGTTKGKSAIKREKKVKASTPPRKVLRSGVASAKKNNHATRVLALWSPDRYYYTGTVGYVIEESQYQVHFDDKNTAPLPIEYLRTLTFCEGDIVEYNRKRCSVVSAHRIAQDLVKIRYGAQDIEVTLVDIRIPAKIVTTAWADRLLAPENIVPQCQPQTTGNAVAPDTKSTVTDKEGLLAGMAFLVSLGGKDLDSLRKSLGKRIENAGGQVIAFDTVLPIDRKYIKGNQAWEARRNRVQWKGDLSIESLFLLASEATRRPKYLTALALGIPCVSHAWIEEALAQEELGGWHRYLLPHGHSEHLGRTLSQMVDFNWGTDPAQLNDIMFNPVPFKVLDGSSLLMLGKHWFTIDKAVMDEATRCCVAMGADRVDAASHQRYAPRGLPTYTYVVTYTKEEGAGLDIPDSQRRDWPWVMDCLMSNRLIVPVPHEEVQSQEV